MGLKVIGLGGPRTGTASLKTALETLGFGQCQHMENLFNRPELVDYWIEFFETGKTDFDTLFDGFQSTTDFPGYLMYQELMEKYPDAKLILGLRDPEEWYASFQPTVYTILRITYPEKLKTLPKDFLESPRLKSIGKTFGLVTKYLLEKHYQGKFADKEHTLDIYRKFNDEIRHNVPKDRLLEYRITDGWEPLCEFLGQPVPEQEFPKRNQRAQFIAQLNKMLDSGGQLKIK